MSGSYSMKRLAAEETIVAVPVIVEPVPVLVPAVVVPVDVRDVLVVVGVPQIMRPVVHATTL